MGSRYTWLLLSGVACVVSWLYLMLAHGRFWNVRSLVLTGKLSENVDAKIAVVIPARNEADVIGLAVRSLLQQSGGDDIRIFLVDDNSEDSTATTARAAAEKLGRADALTVICGKPLALGWTGKLWALQQGVEQALLTDPDFLLLTDADIEHGPDSVARLAAHAKHQHYDLASLMVKLHCRSAAERLLIPAFVFFFFMLYPPQWISSHKRRVAGAAGGCMLIQPKALARAGGIAAIRHEIIDDCALARAVKRSGGRVWLGTTAETQSTRRYESFGEIERMISRTAFNQLQHSAWLLAGAIAGMALMYLLPVGLVVSGNWTLALMGGGAWALMCACYLPIVRFYGLRPIWALSLPASAVFYMSATVHSAVKFWTGRGGEWKGRAQDANS